MSRRKRNNKPHKTASAAAAVVGACACQNGPQKGNWFNQTIAWFKGLPFVAQVFSGLAALKEFYEVLEWCKSAAVYIISKWPVVVAWLEAIRGYCSNL